MSMGSAAGNAAKNKSRNASKNEEEKTSESVGGVGLCAQRTDACVLLAEIRFDVVLVVVLGVVR